MSDKPNIRMVSPAETAARALVLESLAMAGWQLFLRFFHGDTTSPEFENFIAAVSAQAIQPILAIPLSDEERRGLENFVDRFVVSLRDGARNFSLPPEFRTLMN